MTRPASVLAIASLWMLTALAHTQAPQSPAREVLLPAVEPKDASAVASGQLLQAVSQSVASLDATGNRTLEAIANSDVTLTLGDLKDSSAFAVLCIDGGDHLRSFMQSLVQELGLAGKVLRPGCTGVGHGSDPFTLTFHLHYEGGGNGLFSETPLVLPVCLEHNEETETAEVSAGSDQNSPEDASIDAQPISLCSQHIQTTHTVISLPQGWTPGNLPKPTHSDSPFATFDLAQTFEDGTLVTDQKLVIKKDKIDVIDLPAYRKWRDTAEIDNSGPTIALASTLYYPDSAFSGVSDDQKQAAALLGEAYSDIESKNFLKAEEALKQAEALDPGHEKLHDDRGDLAAARGNQATALVEYQKELQAFPEAYIEMESIANTQRAMGNTDAATLTLERWINADPNSPFPVIQLMNLYRDIGRDDLAAAVGDRAMGTLTHDAKQSVKFLLLYGREQMRVGQQQNAKATLEALLDITTDNEFVNDAAYLLSEQGLSLDRDEQVVRDTLLQFEPGPDRLMPHMFALDDKATASFLFSTWDTLGWILFREGKVKEAESYIRATWRSHYNPTIARHLGDLLVTEEKPGEALDIYQMGLATISPKAREEAELDPDVIAIRAAIDRLHLLGTKASIKDSSLALTQLRTLPAGPAGKLHGEWNYRISLTAGEIDAAPAADGKGAEAVVLIDAIKLPSDFFPVDSKAQITVEGRLTCTVTCSLFFPPQ